MDELRKILDDKMRMLIPQSVVMGSVTAVDETDLSVTVIQSDTGTTLHFVRLVPAMGVMANSVVCIPKVGSLCLVGLIGNMPSANYMIMCQQCEKIILNGGTFGGVVKVEELKAQMEKDSKILQALLDVINGATINQPPNTPSVLQAALKSVMGNLRKGDYANIENKNVEHG